MCRRAGVSNLFDRRTKCTNFKLFEGQRTDRAEIEMPKASKGKGMGSGCPPPQPTRSLGEHSKLPQWGPAENEFWRILELEKTHLKDTNLLILTFLQHIFTTDQAR